MSQPYDRVFNFSAGPCTLAVEVLEEARDALLNYCNTGMSVMEMSHRSEAFEAILHTTEQDLRTLLGIGGDYRVLFLQGGASLQFSMVAMTFLRGGSADYVLTGTWGKKSYEAAQLEGTANLIWDGKSGNYSDVPDLQALSFTPGAEYIHFTSSETIQGVEFKTDPTLAAPVVCDMSSDILSRPVDISKYALIYAGSQKNMGPAGTTVVIIRDDMLARVPEKMHPMLDYRLQAQNESMYNTPPCWGIYMCGLTYRHLMHSGGVVGAQKRNEEKAGLLYSAIDESNGYYAGHAQKHCRSNMNVTFTLAKADLTDAFVEQATAQGLDGLKGHRSVGGIRASIYNAMPREGCEQLAQFMRDFAKSH